MPTRLCAERACPNPATYRGRCSEHAQQVNQQTHPNKAIYGSKRWQMARRQVLTEEPFCACGCGRLSEDVDHVVPIEQGGAVWNRSNLQGLAHHCHSVKTRREQHGLS